MLQEYSADRVSLTIQAPMNVRVDRKEIRLAKNRERRAAGFLQISGDASGVGRDEAKSDVTVTCEAIERSLILLSGGQSQ